MKKITITLLICIISIFGITHSIFSQKPGAVYIFYLSVFLEGPYNGTDMNTSLFDNGILPVNQPYNVEPWNYNGTKSLSASQGADVVDWVLVEFLQTEYGPESATPDKVFDRQAALLMADGSITFPDGINPIFITATITDDLYIVIRHRNHLAVMSAIPLVEIDQTYTYDFTDVLSKAYLDGQKEIALGLFGMVGGDCDANGIIENTDKDLCWTTKSGNMGYLPGDWNLDLQVNNPDKDDIWLVNMGLESKVPRALVCGEVLTDFRDGQTYNTVLIGNQCWMAENLNIGIRIDGVIGQINNGTVEKYCYNNLENNCDTYGGLYQWNEMMKYITDTAAQGICPDSWHIPSDEEWKQLEGEVDSQYGYPDPEWDIAGWRGFDVGLNLKSTSGWSSGGNGVDLYGFMALPGGACSTTGFSSLTFYGNFWLSSQSNGSNGWSRYISHSYDQVHRTTNIKSWGFSVRCLKTNFPPDVPSNPSPEDGAIEISVDTNLTWSCNDPENDSLTYYVYFGTDTIPSLLSEGIPDPFYDPGIMHNGTTYFWKIVAHDDHGNSTESPVWNFKTKFICGDSLFDVRDNQLYKTVLIGYQCWMAENLNIGTMIPGQNDPSNNEIIEKYCYDDNTSNCDTYGAFYQWLEMMDYITDTASQGICPEGWHIPTNFEWKILEGNVDSQFGVGDPEWEIEDWRGHDAGLVLKSVSGWFNNGNGTDAFGFTALPTGQRRNIGDFVGIDELATFWTSSPYTSPTIWSWRRYLQYDHNDISNGAYYRERGISVRCLKTNQPPNVPSNPSPENGAINQPINSTLLWTCVDPENDPLTYDIYFGSETDPPLLDEGISNPFYDLQILNYGITYYWKIVVQDDHGNITAGSIWSFTTEVYFFVCGDDLFDIRDGQNYNTVQIGTQCWMGENLNLGDMIIGSDNQTDNGFFEKYCYDDNTSNCDIYGGLYQWDEMMQYSTIPGIQGICPTGWHSS